MSDESTPEEKAAIKAAAMQSYPMEMHFVGGPYCGCILEPREELMYDVHRQLHPHTRSVSLEAIPTNFVPVTETKIVLDGWDGPCLYELVDLTKQWAFVSHVQLIQPDTSE